MLACQYPSTIAISVVTRVEYGPWSIQQCHPWICPPSLVAFTHDCHVLYKRYYCSSKLLAVLQSRLSTNTPHLQARLNWQRFLLESRCKQPATCMAMMKRIVLLLTAAQLSSDLRPFSLSSEWTNFSITAENQQYSTLPIKRWTWVEAHTKKLFRLDSRNPLLYPTSLHVIDSFIQHHQNNAWRIIHQTDWHLAIVFLQPFVDYSSLRVPICGKVHHCTAVEPPVTSNV